MLEEERGSRSRQPIAAPFDGEATPGVRVGRDRATVRRRFAAAGEWAQKYRLLDRPLRRRSLRPLPERQHYRHRHRQQRQPRETLPHSLSMALMQDTRRRAGEFQ